MSHIYKRIFLTAVLAGGLSGNVFAEDVVKSSASTPEIKTKPLSNLPPTMQKQLSVEQKTPAAISVPAEKKAVPAAPQVTAEKAMEYKVPCLTVRGDETSGKITYMPLKFTRSQVDKPLRVMITDDTPSGSGQSIHSSVWLAAVTAAMLRNDTMHGVTISVEFTGNVDGPSAGGVTCLAILSAMDGLPLPKDFAMTGTILPDGTIGVVGGVPEKMRAAAKAGVKRIFIPAFLRIFKNAKGEDVDLSRLADELKVELHRVENISEAYAILHNKPYHEGDYVNVRNMTKLSREVEDVLLPVYRDLYKKVSEKMKAQPKLERCYVIDDYVLSPSLAQDYYQEGKLLPATLQIFRSWQAWQAWEKTDAFLEKFYKEKNPEWGKIKYLREYHFRKLLFAIREASDKQGKALFEEKRKKNEEYIKKHYKGTEKRNGYFPFIDGLSEITAQVEPVDLDPMLSGKLKVLAMKRPAADKVKTFSQKDLDACWNTEVDLLRLLFLATADDSSVSDFLGRLGKALPPLHANKRAADVERLFYSAACAADSVAGQNFQSAVTAMADSGRKDSAETEVRRNPVISAMIEMEKHAQYCHYLLQPDSEKKPSAPEYHLQASLKAQVNSFAFASAILVMYGADQSNDFIPHLWRNARSAAIRNINDCVKAGIPCLPAICDFETAEASRNNKDAVFALVSYWRASLYSKALLMSFNQNKQN